MGTTVTNQQPIEATSHQLKLLQMPSIDQAFPITFHTGFRMETIQFACAHCESDIPMTSVHGTLSQLIERVVDIDAMAKCPKCTVSTPFRIRVYSDRKCEWQTMGGNWKSFMVYSSDKAGAKDALRGLLSALKERFSWRHHG